MAASASSGRPPPAPHPPYMFTTPPPTWIAPDLIKTTTGHTQRRIIRTPREHGTRIYVAATVAADIKTTMETQAMTAQRPIPHDNDQAQPKTHTIPQHSIDNYVKQTMGCTTRRIVRTRREPGTRVYAAVSAAAPFMPTTKPHALATQWSKDDKPKSTASYNTANPPSPPLNHPPGANKLADMTHCQMQPAAEDPCSADPNPNTPTHNQKHLALPDNTLKAINIYMLPGFNMGSSLKPTHGDNDSHHLPDILDKTKDNNRHKLEPMTAQLISTDRIHPADIEAIAASPIHRSMRVRNAKITNCDKRTPIFAISLPPHPPTTNHSEHLITPTSPCLTTADDPRIPQPSHDPYGTIPSANTKQDNHSNTPKTDPPCHSTLLDQQNQLGTNTNQLHEAEIYQKQRRHSTPTDINTTVIAPKTASNTHHGGATHTRHDITATSHAFWPPTDNATPQLPTTDNPRNPHTSSAPRGLIHPDITTSDNHSATPLNELHGHPTLLNPHSHFDINTDQPNDAEAQHKLRSYSPHTVITTVVAPTKACNNPHDGETHTRHDTTDTSHAFQTPTAAAYTFTTTAHSHSTALVAHLQRLYHPPPTTHITTTILTQPIWSDLRPPLQPFTAADTHDTAPTAKSPKITAAASGTQNSPTPLDSQTHPTVSFNHRRNNMSQSPFMDVFPTDLIKLTTSPPHTNQFTTPNNNTSLNETNQTMMMTTNAERTQKLNIPYDWHEFPRPPEMIATLSSKTSSNAMHPTTMTITASVKRMQHSKIPNNWKAYPRLMEMLYSTKLYLPHTDIRYTAKLRPNNLEPPHPHSTNPNRSTPYITAHCTTYNHRTTDHRKLEQQAFYHKANLRPP